MRFLVVGIVFCGACGLAWADPVLQLDPSMTSVTVGDSFSVDINIAGLGLPPATEVGSFDVFIGFDPALLTPTGVSFSLSLGDPQAFEALTAQSFGSDFVEAAEVSLLSNSQLDSLQTSSMLTLATLSFKAISSGTTSFSYEGGPVDNGEGVLIAGTKTVVPEPDSLLLLVCVLALCAWKFRDRPRVTIQSIRTVVRVH